MVFFIPSERWCMTDSPSDSPSPRARRSALSPAARALRLQRIFARLQDGAAYADIAAEEGFSRERLRQIIRAATAPGVTVTLYQFPYPPSATVTRSPRAE